MLLYKYSYTMTLDDTSRWHVVLDGLPVKDYVDFEEVSLVKMGYNQIHVFVKPTLNPITELMKYLKNDFWLEHYGAEKLILTRKEYNFKFIFKKVGDTAKLIAYGLTKEDIGLTVSEVGFSVIHWSFDLAAGLIEIHHGLKVTHNLKPYEPVPFEPQIIMKMYVVEDVVYPMLVSAQVEHDRLNLIKYYRSLFFSHWPKNVFLTLEDAEAYLKKKETSDPKVHTFVDPRFYTLNGRHFHVPIQPMDLTMSLNEEDKRWSKILGKMKDNSTEDMDCITASIVARMAKDEEFKNEMFTTLNALKGLDENILKEIKNLL